MMEMNKRASATAVSAAVAAAAVCGALAACPAAMAKTAAPSQPTQTTVYAADCFEATVSWKKVAGADRFQVRLAESKDALPSAKAQDVEATDHEGYIVRQHATVSGLSAGTEYFFQVRAGKSYTEKAKVGKKAYKAAKAAGEKTSTKAVRQYKAKKKSGKWTKWRAAKPSGYKKSSKRYKTRTVTRYYVKTAKCAWSPWGQAAESAASIETELLPAANATENGRAQSELVVPEGGVAVSYVGLSKPWTGSGSEATVLRLDGSEGLWEPADEKLIDGFQTGDYDTGEYCFKGWYLDEALTKPCADAKAAEAAAEDGEVTLYAKWGAHDYEKTKVYRKVSTPCGWIRNSMPMTTDENRYDVNGFFKTNVPIDHWKEVYRGQITEEVDPIWAGFWTDIPEGSVAGRSNPLFDWSDCDKSKVGLRYNTDTCTWEAADLSDIKWGFTENMCAYWPLEYEVCPDCNHVGERITKLMHSAHITTQFTFAWTSAGLGERLCGNVAGNRTGEDVVVPYGGESMYKVTQGAYAEE